MTKNDKYKYLRLKRLKFKIEGLKFKKSKLFENIITKKIFVDSQRS